MGFFSQLKQGLKNQMASQPTPQPIMRLPNKGITSLPQENLNLDFLKRLPKNMMPNLDFSNIPQLPQNFKFNPQFGGMVPGMWLGGIIPAARGIAGFLGRTKAVPKNLPGTRPIPKNIPGTRPLPGRGQPGQFMAPANALNRIRNTENAIIGGGIAGGAALTDATQGWTEQAKWMNMMLHSPEQLGKDLAGMRIGLDELQNIASQKAQEIGASVTEYVNRAKKSYQDEMNAENLINRTLIGGSGMPLFKPEETEKNPVIPRQQNMMPNRSKFIRRQVQDRIQDVYPDPPVDRYGNPLPLSEIDSGFANGGPAFSISDPFEDEMERRKTTEEMLQELLASDQSNLSGQDLQTISELVNKTENQPYRMV